VGEEGLFNKSRGGGHGLLKTTPYATIRVEYDWREQFDFNRGGGVKIALWTLLWEDSVLLRVLINSGSNMIFPFFFSFNGRYLLDSKRDALSLRQHGCMDELDEHSPPSA